MTKIPFNSDIEVDGKIIKKGGDGTKALMDDGTTQTFPTQVEQNNILRTITLDPNDLTTQDKAGVLEYLNTNGITVLETENILIKIGDDGMWTVTYTPGYETRVTNNYGALENDIESLDISLSDSMTEAEFLDALALYNPNGGYRTGKIYNVKDTHSRGSYNLINESWDIGQGIKVGVTTSLHTEKLFNFPSFKVSEDTATSYHYVWMQTGQIRGDIERTIHVKKGNRRYVYISARDFDDDTMVGAEFDLDTGTVVSNNASYTPTITDVGNGWYKITVFTIDSQSGFYDVGMKAGMTNTSGVYNYAGTDGYTYMAHAQVTLETGNSGIGVRPYVVNGNGLDLTVAGGGGTRFNAAGDAEDIVINKIVNSLYLTPNSGASTYTVESNIPAPDGSLTAKRWTLDSNTYGVMRRLSAATGQLTNYSIYARAGKIRLNHDNHLMVEFDANAGTYEVTYTRSPDVYYENDSELAKMTDVGGGWYRCSIMLDGNLDPDLWTDMDTNEGAIGSSVELWGEQLSFGSLYVKPFQLTTGTAAFPKIDHSTGQPGFLIEPTVTNNESHSYDLFTNTAWATGNTNGDVLLNETGIEGIPNTALTLTDTSDSGYFELTRSSLTLNKKAVVSFWIKKDNDETRFPEIYILLTDDTDGSNQDQTIHLNTKTGAWTFRTSQYNDCIVNVRDRGLWWEVLVTLPVPTNPVRTLGNFAIRPAMATTIGTVNYATQGSIILGHVGIYTDTSDIKTPIVTNGAAVTRTKNYYYNLNIPDMQNKGAYLDIELDNYVTTTTPSIVTFGHVDDPHRYKIALYKQPNGTDLQYYIRRNNTTIYSGTVAYAGGRLKIYMDLDPTDGYKLFINGSLALTVSGSVVAKSLDTVVVGNGNLAATSEPQYWHADRTAHFHLYDFRLLESKTDQEAIDLTTI